MTIFRGELQLLRWSETSTGGATVTFQLPNVADLNGFKDLTLAKKGMAGQIIAAIMVKTEDEPVPEVAPAAATEPKTKPGELCIMACAFCKDGVFWFWLQEEMGLFCDTEDGAKDFITDVCRIGSRKELDTDPAAAREFHTHIRAPFIAWRAKRGAA